MSPIIALYQTNVIDKTNWNLLLWIVKFIYSIIQIYSFSARGRGSLISGGCGRWWTQQATPAAERVFTLRQWHLACELGWHYFIQFPLHNCCTSCSFWKFTSKAIERINLIWMMIFIYWIYMILRVIHQLFLYPCCPEVLYPPDAADRKEDIGLRDMMRI